MNGFLATRRSASKWFRRGTATVEAAVCFPLLVLVAFGSMELNNQYYVRRSMVLAAFEAGRLVSEDGSKSQDIKDLAAGILDQRGVKGYQITLSPHNMERLKDGDEVTVTIAVSKADNQLVPMNIGGPTMTVSNFTIR